MTLSSNKIFFGCQVLNDPLIYKYYLITNVEDSPSQYLVDKFSEPFKETKKARKSEFPTPNPDSHQIDPFE